MCSTDSGVCGQERTPGGAGGRVTPSSRLSLWPRTATLFSCSSWGRKVTEEGDTGHTGPGESDGAWGSEGPERLFPAGPVELGVLATLSGVFRC